MTTLEGLNIEAQQAVLYARMQEIQQRKLRRICYQAAKQKRVTPDAVEAYAALHLINEDNNQPILAARHHKLWLHFLCDTSINRLMIIAPYGSAKTTWAIKAYVGLYTAVFPERSVLIACNGDDTALVRSSALRTVTMTQEYRKTFPDLHPHPNMPWTDSEWTLERDGHEIAGRINPTVRARGQGGQVIGARGDLLIADDLLDDKNTATAGQRRSVERWLNTTFLSRTRNARSRVIAIGTSWHIDDFYSKAKTEGGWVVVHLPYLSETPEVYATIYYPDNWSGQTIGQPLSATV